MYPFFLGILAAIGSLTLELIIFSLSSADYSGSIQIDSIKFLIIAAIIEEFFKLSMIWREFMNLTKRGQEKKIFFHSIFIGSGFFFSELFLKQFAYKEIPILPFLGVLVVHLSTAIIAGLFFSKRGSKNNKLILFFTFSLNLIIHILYNIAVLYYF